MKQEKDTEICAGPNHGNPNALPAGHRVWYPGHCISLTQTIDDGPSSQMTFCGPDCMCDWHGAAAAFEQDHLGEADFEVPGRWTLCWITPLSTTIGGFTDFAKLTAQIGDYQMRLLEMQAKLEEAVPKPLSEDDLA